MHSGVCVAPMVEIEAAPKKNVRKRVGDEWTSWRECSQRKERARKKKNRYTDRQIEIEIDRDR